MNGYELADQLRQKVTITNAMQAADMLVELEDKLKKKTGKKDESKPSGDKDKDGVSAQPKAVDNNGSKDAASRVEVKSNINEPVLPYAFTLGNAGSS
jgi:hypothetical protein